MNTIEQARDVAECLRALTRNRNDGSAYLIAADTIDALIAEFEKVTVERDHVNDVCDSYVAELASIKQQEPVGVVVRVDSAMAPGCSYLQGTMIKNTPDGALLYLAAGAYPAPCNPLCELCIKRGYTECANVTVTTPLPMLAQGQRKP